MEMKPIARVMQCGFIAIVFIISSFSPAQILAQVQRQVQRQDCMNQLQPCLYYLNERSKPPDSCCRPLDYIIKSVPECLCSLMSIQGADQAEQAGINVTQAQTLPGRCGQRINPLGCVTGTPNTNAAISKLSSMSTMNVFVVVASAIIVMYQALCMVE